MSDDDVRLARHDSFRGCPVPHTRGAATLAHIGNGPFAHRERARRSVIPPAWIKRSQSATTRYRGAGKSSANVHSLGPGVCPVSVAWADTLTT